jgi:hypothetical protein
MCIRDRVYTNQNNWSRFGGINLSESSTIGVFDNLTINNSDFNVSSGTQQFTISNGLVGIGTSPQSGVALKVNGKISGDGSGLTGVSDIWVTDSVGIHTNTPIGINTTSAKSEYAMYLEGSMAINGSLRVFEIIEKATIDNRTLTNASIPIYLANNNVYYFVRQPENNWTLSFSGDPTVGSGNTGFFLTGEEGYGFLDVGETMTVAVIVSMGATAFYNNNIIVDGSSITPYYYGGEKIGAGNTNGIDVYTYVFIRKAAPPPGGSLTVDNQITVLYSQAQYTKIP